jgi:signal transduction histidine kinase
MPNIKTAYRNAMFKNRILRYIFIILLFVGILFPAANIYLVLPYFTDLFINNVEDEAVRLGNHLSDLYFNENKPVETADVKIIENNINKHIQHLHLINLKIFSPEGNILYSVNKKDIGTVNQKDYFHNVVAKGSPYTKLVEKDTISLEGQNVIADVIETYVPIMSKGRFMGAFEIYYDVTNKKEALNKVILKASVIPVAMTFGGFILTIMILLRLDKTMSRQKKTEEELKIYSVRLQNSNKELQDFAHIASHDLQEPLRKITAFSDRLKIRYADALDETGLDYIKRMQNAAYRMQKLIEGLMAYSRVTTKAQPFETVNLSSIAHEVLSDLEVRIQNSGGRVEIGELPTVHADPLQMRQLFQNLIANALKFHKQESSPVVKVYADTSSESNGEVCRVTVKDNGIGFDEKYADRIFGVFQRLHGKQEYEGSGIGLSVCRRIVERHGGTITAKSAPGEGATFTIDLPLNQDQGGNNGR